MIIVKAWCGGRKKQRNMIYTDQEFKKNNLDVNLRNSDKFNG